MPTVVELRKLARAQNIKGRSKMNKAELMKALNITGKTKGRKFALKNTDFKPNLSPRQVIKLGSFGGTYWRPINSKVTGKSYKNKHKVYPESWWKDIPEDHMTRSWDNYDKNIIIGKVLEKFYKRQIIKFIVVILNVNVFHL